MILGMRSWEIIAAATILPGLLVGCGGTSEGPTEIRTAGATRPATTATASFTAAGVADALAEATGVTTLGNPTDNTGGCDGDGGCEQLITTDTVSIYQFADAAVAKRW